MSMKIPMTPAGIEPANFRLYLLRNKNKCKYYYKFYSLWKILRLYLYKSRPVSLCSFLKMRGANV